MSDEQKSMLRRGWVGSVVLLAVVLAIGSVLAAWKYSAIQHDAAASANQPEPMEAIKVSTAHEINYRHSTTSIGTVLALRSVTLRNELAGTIDEVHLPPGQIVEPGAVLVKLDTAVEEAELKAQQAQAALAATMLQRVERAGQNNAVSQIEIDRARAEHDVAVAQISRIEAIIDRKTILAPFRARVGLSNVHVGQYLGEGTELTTLQSVDDAVHVDFTVTQQVASGLREGDTVEILARADAAPSSATIVAIDAHINELTRNATVRARVEATAQGSPAPGASVRVRVPVGEERVLVAIPVSAVRKGPGGDHVFVISNDSAGLSRAHFRQVRSGPMIGDEVLMYSGITAGEEVAASGSFKLREGLLVSPANPGDPQSNSQGH
jgi:membrane fusion protein (multidrug efflux system)